MKRLIALILAFALVFCLAACGKKEEAAPTEKKKSSKYDDLIEMLEDEDYEDALAYIRDLAGEEIPETTDPIYNFGGIVTEPNTEEAENSPLLSYLYGTWMQGGALAGSQFESTVVVGLASASYDSYTFYADGSCAFDEKALSWKAYSCTETSLSLDIYEGEVKSYSAELDETDGSYQLTVYQIQNMGNNSFAAMMEMATLFNPDHYEAVTVTQDNWQEYFEFTHEDVYSFNSFDEANGLSISYRFALKPEYFQKISSFTAVEGALELDFATDSYDITVDYPNKAYTIGEKSEVQNIISIGTSTDHTYTLGMGDNDAFYGCSYCSGTVYDTTLSGYPTDMQVVRLQVTLYLTK